MKPIKFLHEPEACRKCGTPTVTLKVGGRTPLHVMCDTRPVPDMDAREFVDEVLTVLANVLGPVTMNPTTPQIRPKDIGFCVTCRRPTRRYGPWATPLCPHCREQAS